MTPRRAALALLDERRLRRIARDLGLDPHAELDRERLAARLADHPGLATGAIVPCLDDDELRRVARACGLLGSGNRDQVLERLERRIAFEPPPSGKRRGSATAGPRSGRAGQPSPRPRGTSGPFVAIDFETADHGPDSACAVALVRVENGTIVRRESRLVRPPRPRILFTRIHGITWEAVRDEPGFDRVWPELAPVLEGAAFLVAHNAGFDRRVLEACCRAAGLEPPDLPFRCTLALARTRLGLPRSRLPDVCTHLGIPLVHHDAASDAEACARVLLALEAG